MKHKYAFIAFIGCISLILSFTGISDYSSKISDYAPLPTYSGVAPSNTCIANEALNAPPL